MSLVMVSWRGKEIGLEICRSEEQAEELRKRWDGGPVVIERIFEIVSPSSTAARCNLANRVLELCGEPLRLDRSKSPEELSAELQALSADAPPAPIRPEAFVASLEVRALASNVLETMGGVNPDFAALYPDIAQYLEAYRAKLERVAAGEPIDTMDDPPAMHLTMFVRAMQQCAKLLGGGVRQSSETDPHPMIDAEEQTTSPMVATMAEHPRMLTGAEKAELARRVRQQEAEAMRADPTQLTGDQKRALSMSGGMVKSKPRQPLADQGIDPTQLTGAQKRALTQRPRRNEVIVTPADPNVLTEAERSELSMLRAAQGALAWERVDGESEERGELRARRTWTRPTNQGQPPAA